MLNLLILFKPLTYIPKLCSLPEIPEEYSKAEIEKKNCNELNVLWRTFEIKYLNPKKDLAKTWKKRHNVISLIEKITIVTIVILGYTHSRFAERLKRPVIIFDYSKIKGGISVIAAVSISKLVVKTIFIYHKRVSSTAISRGADMHKILTAKLAENKKD